MVWALIASVLSFLSPVSHYRLSKNKKKKRRGKNQQMYLALEQSINTGGCVIYFIIYFCDGKFSSYTTENGQSH